jgi:hypothetical protein
MRTYGLSPKQVSHTNGNSVSSHCCLLSSRLIFDIAVVVTIDDNGDDNVIEKQSCNENDGGPNEVFAVLLCLASVFELLRVDGQTTRIVH